MRILCTACLALVLLAPIVHAQDDREASFKAGLDAQKQKRWQEMAAHMRRAIQINPKEDSKKVGAVLGLGGTEYLPYYFLGEALFNLQDCAGAVEAWSVSEQQGVVRTRAESVAFMQKGYAECEAKGILLQARYAPLLAKTRQQLIDVGSLAGAISKRGESHIEIWRADSSLREQYDRAVTELQTAQSRLAVASRTRSERDFGDASAAAERARGILNTLGTQLDAAITAVTSAQVLARDIEQLLQEAQELDAAIDAKKVFMTPALAGARQTANQAVGRSRAQLNAGRSASNAALLNDARTIVVEATGRFRQVLDEIGRIEKRLFEERLAEAIAKAKDAFSFAAGAFATLEARFASKPTEATPDKIAQRDALQKQFAALERRRDGAVKSSNIAGLQQATQLAEQVRMQLDAIVSTFGPVTIIERGVRPELAEGARLFFAGEYDQALGVLDPEKLRDVPLQMHVHLFRAAALYALYVRSGEKDQARRAEALAEVARCKQLSPAFQPNPRAFAPRFISFFQTPS